MPTKVEYTPTQERQIAKSVYKITGERSSTFYDPAVVTAQAILLKPTEVAVVPLGPSIDEKSDIHDSVRLPGHVKTKNGVASYKVQGVPIMRVDVGAVGREVNPKDIAHPDMATIDVIKPAGHRAGVLPLMVARLSIERLTGDFFCLNLDPEQGMWGIGRKFDGQTDLPTTVSALHCRVGAIKDPVTEEGSVLVVQNNHPSNGTRLVMPAASTYV